jgi:hypothetical protein
MVDDVAPITVGSPLAFPQGCAVGAHRWLSHGRARTTSCWRLEDVVDLLVEEVVAAVDAVAVDGEQDSDAVSGPGGDLGGVSTAVQPQRQGGVPLMWNST